MNRRGFLTAALGTALAAGELWKPARTIFLPPRGGWPDGSMTLTSARGFDDLYVGTWLYIKDGNGTASVRRVTAYEEKTRVVTIGGLLPPGTYEFRIVPA